MAKIGIVAADYGESICLDSVSHELERRGYQVSKLLGNGQGLRPSEEDISCLIRNDLLLVAISEANEKEVEIAERAAQLKVPVIAYAPGIRACCKISAKPLREFCSLLLLGNKADEGEAGELFPEARIRTVGNVLHENGHPTVSREESRQMLGATDAEKVIFVPGDKRLGINWPLFHSVIEAAHRNEVMQYKPVVVIGLHPGDPNPTECYMDAAKYSRKVRVLIKTKGEIPGVKIVPGCDLVVTACSTLGEVAAYQRKPVIGFFFENLLADFECQQGKRQFEWDLEMCGGAVAVKRGSVDDLAAFIATFLSPNGRDSLTKSQQRYYPNPPEPGSTSKYAADAIEEHLAYLFFQLPCIKALEKPASTTKCEK